MSANNTSGTLLIRENALLPAGLAVDSEVFLSGWRIVENLDRSALTRKIEGANCDFFYLADEITATVVGRDRPGAHCRAVKAVLAKREGWQANSLALRKTLST